MDNSEIDIGRRLIEAREAAGMTVADVVYRAHLPRSVVVALEAEDFSVFASPTYAKSFLHQYSEFLNVDARPWLDAIEASSFVQTEGLQSLFEAESVAAKGDSLSRSRRKETAGTGLTTLLLMAAITVSVVYGVLKAVDYFEKQEQTAQPAKSETEPKAPLLPITSIAPMVPAAKVSPVATEAPPAPSAEVVKKQEELPAPPPRALIVPN